MSEGTPARVANTGQKTLIFELDLSILSPNMIDTL